MQDAIESARKSIATRMRHRRQEIEQSLSTRVYAIGLPEKVDPEYLRGLRSAFSTSLDYALLTIEVGERRAPPVPPALLTQARLAARYGVALDTVLRRYMAGQAVLAEFLVAVAEESHLEHDYLRRMLSEQAAVFDRLIEAVSDEHRRELLGIPRSADHRRAERVRRLLAGEPIDASQLNYEIQAFHIGMVGWGPAAKDLVRKLASRLDMQPLWVPGEADRIWAWLGSRHPITDRKMSSLTTHASAAASDAVVAFGEPAAELDGWRLSHRQALVALPLAGDAPGGVVRYADVALLASAMNDDLLVESLRRLYIGPLSESSDGGRTLRETLRAYLSAGRNITSAAAALKVNRQTVRKRLRTINELIGRSVEQCSAEVEIALRLAEKEPDRFGHIPPP